MRPERQHLVHSYVVRYTARQLPLGGLLVRPPEPPALLSHGVEPRSLLGWHQIFQAQRSRASGHSEHWLSKKSCAESGFHACQHCCEQPLPGQEQRYAQSGSWALDTQAAGLTRTPKSAALLPRVIALPSQACTASNQTTPRPPGLLLLRRPQCPQRSLRLW